jgi:hypothetical protein
MSPAVAWDEKPSGCRSMRIADSPSAAIVGAPAALHAVELQQVRGGGSAALEFVEVHHVQPVAGARVVR